MESQLSGRILGRYDLRERLGRGGMGDVYKGWDSTLDRWVAVKVLHGHLADEGDFRQRFEREAKTIAGLNHANIVTVFDYGYDEVRGLYCIVLEYLPSETLDNRIETLQEQDLPARLAAVKQIFRPLIEAVTYAHKRGMVHRDIKPSNILFSEAGMPVLADFGLARLVSGGRVTLTGTTAGTPVYMSPEQGIGEAGDSRGDIYSLGVILYEMLAGEPPYSGETPFGIIMKHVNEPLPSLRERVPNLPRQLEAVVQRALAKKADERYQTASDFLDDLLAAIEGGRISDVTAMPQETVRLGTSTLASIAPALAKRPYALFASLAGLAVIFVVAFFLTRSPAGEAESSTQGEAGAGETIPSMAGDSGISDDFSDPTSGWPVEEDGPVRYTYEDGRYHFTNTLPGQARFVMYEQSYSYSATYLEVEAVLEDGQPESGYGLVFRWQDSGNFYVFAVNGRGQVSMWAFEGGARWRELRVLDEEWTDSSAVLTDGTPNVLTLIAEGDHLVGMVNHETVIEVRDSTYDKGPVGFYVATTLAPTDQPLADVFFDNFLVEPATPAMTAP